MYSNLFPDGAVSLKAAERWLALVFAKLSRESIAMKGLALVVDDEALICQLVSDFLSHVGFRVQTALTISEALREVEGRTFDLVVTDYNFPGETPEELIDFLKTRAPLTKIILMSGSISVPGLGVPFLKKPFTLQELRRLLG